MYILGISAYYHDSAAALVKDGELIAAAQEERFTRKKHDESFPINAIQFCLNRAGIKVEHLDFVGFYDKPFLKFERLLQTHLDFFPRGFKGFLTALPIWLRYKLWLKETLRNELGFKKDALLFSDHHLSHAASSFLVSPFNESAIITIDGVGEWSTATFGEGKGLDIQLYHEIRFPHSLGLLYSAFTYYLGFKVNSAEYKIMGLAPYGKPVYYDKIMELMEIREDGSFVMDMSYFEYPYGLRMTNGRFDKLFGGAPRKPETAVGQREADIAASVQKVTEEIMLKMAHFAHQQTGLNNLCLAGGVALNCVANGRLLREGAFKNIFVQPAAGDAGGALGVAFYIYNTILKNPRNYVMNHAYLGTEYTQEQIKKTLENYKAPYEELDRETMIKTVAQLLVEGNVVGWFQGRMEFGPRALGARSILADPRRAEMKDIINEKVKHRESFRPFAPSVLEERVSEFFEYEGASPYMLMVADTINGEEKIPAITHVDGSARLHTVRRDVHPLYYDLIAEFGNLTGIPVILNTSFNVRGEPIVCTPKDAYLCFMRTGIDYLAIGPYLLESSQQPELEEDVDWQEIFELD